MVERVNFVNNPYGVYASSRNFKEGSLTIAHYDNLNRSSIEKIYKFNKDGSGTVVSAVTGKKSNIPAGTFSSVMFHLRNIKNIFRRIY